MSSKTPIIVGGQPVGTLKASWLLFKETWRFLQADRELLWLPVLTLLLNGFLFAILIALFVITSGIDALIPTEGETFSITQWAFIFGCYLVGAFSVALGQAAISFTVFTRAHEGSATLGQSLKVAFSHWYSLLVWSLVTSTVGIIIQAIMERSQLLGKIFASLLGAAWSVLTYFVVPAIVIDKQNTFASISTSGQIFKKTWGETFISNISLTAVFLVIHVLGVLALIGGVIFGIVMEIPLLIFPVVILYLAYFVGAIIIASAMGGVLKTLLYIYARDNNRPKNFNEELLGQMLVKTNVAPPASTIEN